jgi:hypothetical protein
VQNETGYSRGAAQSCIKKALAALGAAYGHPGRHVRTNIMLVNGRNRRVDADTAFNMDGDPDHDLEIDITAGVSGEAFVQRATVFGDLRLALQEGGPTWGLRTAERAKIRRELRSILSVPLYDPDDPEGDLLGTLQVDSDLSITEMGFDVPEQRVIAERFADVIALLLKARH